ncbi:hypothetical protein VNN41_11105 (plasmid) [Lactococcus garvieae]
MKKITLSIVFAGTLLLAGGVYVINSNHVNNTKASTSQEIKKDSGQEQKTIPYGDNYTVQGCIKKFHTYDNFEKAIKDVNFMTDETIVILEPDVNPDEAGLWAPGPNGITHLNHDGSVKDTVTDKDPRATTIKHIKEALKVVDENAK